MQMIEMSFLGSATFPPPKELTIDDFCYKLRAYMNLLNPSYSQIFERVDDNSSTVIRDEDLHEVHQTQ